MINVENKRSSLAWIEAGEGAPILFLHAYPFNASMWEPQLASLPPGWRGIAVDMPGFGSSPGAPTTLEAYADELVGLLDHLELERAVLCGLSMGGYAALSVVRRHPGRVRALVLCDTRAKADSPEAKAGRQAQAQRLPQDGMGPTIETMLPKLITRANRINQPQLRSRVEDMMKSTSPAAAARALLAIANRPDSTELLRDIVAPTMVIVGAEDEITPAGDSQTMARAIRGARLEVIADAGHLSNMEQPALFNAALRSFLTYLPPPPLL